MFNINIAPFITKYVRALHAREDNIEIPFSETQFGVVLMADVVGFSKLTTLATEKGESSPEAISSEIGEYMGECIQIIEFYGGDVVKFLGDALLVCFQPNVTNERRGSHDSSNDEEPKGISQRQKHVLIRKAVECGLQLLARQSHFRVYLTAEEIIRHRGPDGEIQRHHQISKDEKQIADEFYNGKNDNQPQSLQEKSTEYSSSTSPFSSSKFNCWNYLNNFKRKTKMDSMWSKVSDKRRASTGSNKLPTSDKINCIDLELHIALSCGDVTNVILGDISPQGPITDVPFIRPQIRNSKYDIVGDPQSGDDYFSKYNGRLEYAIGGEAVDALDLALAAAKAGELSITPEAFQLIDLKTMPLSFEMRNGYYVIKGLDWMIGKNSSLAPSTSTTRFQKRMNGSVSINPNADYLLDRPGLMNVANQLKIEPLVPKTRDNAYMALASVSSSLQYYKYLNRSSLYRLQHGNSENFPAQIRDVTIMFISLGKIKIETSTGLKLAQKVLFSAIRRMVKYEGAVQQFAIDDKGATILCIFGLPPLSHENEPVFAAKAAIKLRDEYRKYLSDFSISLSTGGIFNAVLPMDNPYRRDAAIAGDAIVLAVRMLKFPFSKRNIVCDQATKDRISTQCDFEDFGANYVKGKKEPVNIYGLINFNNSESKGYPICGGKDGIKNFIGYEAELEKATLFLNDWQHHPDHHFLVITGHSGVGKSFFCRTLQKKIEKQEKLVTCWTVSTEVEKSSKYNTIRNLVIAILQEIDSDNIPAKANKLRQNKNVSSKRGSDLSSNFINIKSTKRASSNYSTSSDDQQQQLYQKRRRPSLLDRPHVTTGQRDEHHSSSSSCSNQNFLLSPRPTSYYSNPKDSYRQDINKELMELVIRCLIKCGENESVLPLFRDLALGLGDIEDNRHTRSIDGRAREILLIGVIVNMVQYLSKHVSILIICDDMQWADTSSISMLQQIHERCKNVMMLFSCRLAKSYDVSFIQSFKEKGINDTIVLSGLQNSDVAKIILHNCGSNVERVNQAIVKAVQFYEINCLSFIFFILLLLLKKSNVAILLKDFDHVTVYNGELIPTSNQFVLENFLGKFNYNQVASCLDQYFSIYEVGVAIQPTNTIYQQSDLKVVQDLIEKYDVYNFLQHTSEDDNNKLDKDAAVYSFLHDTIPKTIYGMVSFERRIILHRSLARYYEQLLNIENQGQVLAKVTRHYLQTDDLEKQLYYLERLAEYNMESYLLPEATDQLERIVKILDENEDLASEYGLIHYSDIYYRLGVCFTMRTELNEGERYLLMALACLNHSWPKNKIIFGLKYWRKVYAQYKYRHWPVLWKLTEGRLKPELGKRIIDIMRQLSNIYVYTGNGQSFSYTSLVGLNVCAKLKDRGPNYTLFLARHSLVCWLHEHKQNSVYYMTKALQFMNTNSDADTLSVCSYLYFAAGKFKDTRSLAYRAVLCTRTLGVVTDCQAFYRAVGLILTTRIFEGRLDDCPSDLNLMNLMAETARVNRDYEAEIWLNVYNLGNAIIKDQLEDICDEIIPHLESQHLNTSKYNAIAIHGTLLCYYARKNNYDQAIHHMNLFMDILPALTITPNLFPIYGLIFAVMGLYCIIEDTTSNVLLINTKESYNAFNWNLARLNNAFQQVKLWEFTEPCLYLARAFPYIFSGRTVEGYMVLRHGVFEMKFINEIKFLKAYYYSNLGKYAFTPMDRIEWTKKARSDFERLNIPVEVYCNPDPINCYHEGKVADYTMLNNMLV
ncbi:hypothetical protein BJ944DRAFT_228992 [Cunninghamella echinulata]|nr:hypothetical protein BJ944DRAFT_228992 [Cunninghamella echinulata]